MHVQETNPEVVKRLRRAYGHLASVITMIEEGRSCLESAQQLHAVEKAVSTAKQVLIHHHIDHCVAHTAEGGKTAESAVHALKEITKYL